MLPIHPRRAAALLLVLCAAALPDRADAQGIGFQGGVSVDPEQAFVGTHFETGEIFQGLRFRPGIDGGFVLGRPLTAKIFCTAWALVASAPRP